ncbi:FGGY-family carbohydrate kinase [Prolixibacter sp. SD074]|uniref:FGGY-family carbohydrate kinase n=1 Tax=Prolixibacter sp. SD074 TaxID=2652391 RepID=UPI001278930C|nr:FGGY family carbohydrate kinase [Prolixibacter sp. SD074]GET28021.1 carbohydrate kinase [Prolixibacter sp. SD074]
MKGIVAFDIGKTNKKILLFDENFRVVYQDEQKMEPVVDDEGFECDDIARIEHWIFDSLRKVMMSEAYEITAVNFSTYGASLVWLDGNGKRLGPLYNYLKPVDGQIALSLFEKYGGESEFCRQTASPSLGLLLNSGIQLLWMKEKHPDVYRKAKGILHFPQYLSYLLTGQIAAESTSIGCHTFLWDFDHNQYHQWLTDEGIQLPLPLPNSHMIDVEVEGKTLKAGVGIHDSSAALVPYLMGTDERFVLLSTGTWCISMNPFNHESLTEEELKQDCLNYMNIYQKPVKSSRYFLGHIHDVNVERLTNYFGAETSAYKYVGLNKMLLKKYLENGLQSFFRKKLLTSYLDDSVDLEQFDNFETAYHQLMFDLTEECICSLRLVFPAKDDVESLIVSGGFARNEIFMAYLASRFPEKRVYTSEIDNASALGAALVCAEEVFGHARKPVGLGLKRWYAL